jgi:hypothetical protein
VSLWPLPDCEGPYFLTVNEKLKKGVQGDRAFVKYIHWVQRPINQRQSLDTVKVHGKQASMDIPWQTNVSRFWEYALTCLTDTCPWPVACAGVIDDITRNTGDVAMSFLRAHAGWVDDAFKLKIDPRIRHKGDAYLDFSDSLSSSRCGPSCGAAVAGMCWLHFNFRSYARIGAKNGLLWSRLIHVPVCLNLSGLFLGQLLWRPSSLASL